MTDAPGTTGRRSAAASRRGSPGPPTASSSGPSSTFRDAPRPRALPGRAGDHRLLPLADPRSPALRTRTATTWPTTGSSTTRSAASPSTRPRRRAPRARHGPARSTSSRTTWASRAGGTPGGRTSSRTGRASPFAPFFDIDWEPAKPELREPDPSPDPRGSLRARPREPGAPARVRGRRVPGALPRHRPADRPVHVSPDPERPAARPRGGARARRSARARAPAHPRRRRPACRRRTETEPERQAERAREKALVKRRLDALTREAPAVKGSSRRRLALQRHPGGSRTASTASTPCSARRPTASPTGAWPGRDQLPPLLRRQRPGRHPHGGPRRLRGDPPAPVPPGPRGPHHRAADRPPRRPLRPRGLPRRAPGSGARASCSGGREDAPTAAARSLYVVVEKVLEPGESLPDALARPRDHRLRVPERAQRALRGPEGRARPRADLPALHGADGALRRRRPRGEAAGHRHDDGQRADRPGPPARAPRRAAAASPGTSPSGP